ncbi:MAG TPA: chloride channel protein [Terriglobales bacterium]|nr:chloride channel protein [Terriglobales bacterium]
MNGPASAPAANPQATSGRRPLWMGEEQLFLLLAVIIGIFAGLAVVCFRIAIDWGRLWLLGSALAPSPLRVLLAPSLAGLVIAVLVIHLFPRARGSGVNQTKGALYIFDGYVPFSTVIGKFITAGLAIGSGQSLGPEDPALQIGAGLASLIGRRLRLSREKLRLIAPVGAAAGLAAAFNAPITAVLFVIEEVIGRWSAGILGAVVLSAVSSVVVERWFLGSEPLFRVPAYNLASPAELLAYAALGVVGGIAGVVFQKLIGGIRPRLKALPRWTQYLQPALAGLIIGVIGLRLPQVMGAGYEYIDQALHSQYTWQILGLLAGAKILSTTFSFSSGTPGGLFAPTLFIGAMIGGAVGGVEHLLLPHLGTSIGVYVLVGMGTLFAGFLRAPLTSVFMILEVSGDYSIILPVIIANTLAYLISRGFQRTPIFDVLSEQDGMHLPSMEEEREAVILRVEDAMRASGAPALRAEQAVVEAWSTVMDCQEAFLFVVDKSGRWSGLLKESLKLVANPDRPPLTLAEIPSLHPMPCVHPDHPLDIALRQIDDYPCLPVVHRANIRQLVGVITLDGIVQTYRNSAPPEDMSE